MAARDRTYLALTPIDGPYLELGVTLQPFVLGDDVVTRGTLKGPSALTGTPGTMYLDAATTALFSVDASLDGPTNLGGYGRLDREVYGPELLRESVGSSTLHMYFMDCEAPEALARCLCGEAPDLEALAGQVRTLYREPLDPIALQAIIDGGLHEIARRIAKHESIPVDPASLQQIVLRGTRAVAQMNAALLAPAEMGDAGEPYRPRLTVPVEETWTLRRLFGRPRISHATRAEAA